MREILCACASGARIVQRSPWAPLTRECEMRSVLQKAGAGQPEASWTARRPATSIERALGLIKDARLAGRSASWIRCGRPQPFSKSLHPQPKRWQGRQNPPAAREVAGQNDFGPVDLLRMRPCAEAELIARCRRGEPEAWAELFDLHYAAAGRFVFQLAPDFTREDVEEICQ